MKAIVSFSYSEKFLFDVAAVPFISTAIKVNEKNGGYHPDKDFEGLEIKLVPDERLHRTEVEQQQDYKSDSEMYQRWYSDGQKENKKLKEEKDVSDKRISELTAALEAMKSMCPHPTQPEEQPKSEDTF